MAQKYVVLDLRDVQESLGAHYNPAMRDEYEGVCEVCQETVPQTANECPICGVPVVWRNSKAWKALYGSPDAYIRLLSVVEPEDKAGIELCQKAGLSGFANQTEAQRWARAARKLGYSRMSGIVAWATRDKRGRGAIAHALNLAEKIVREEAIPKPKRSPMPAVPMGEEKELIF
jgi:hypothetical protein